MGKTVSLVLGSGGARGLAHIGVIQALEEHGYEIASISGCSMGAVIGGVYAAGKLQEFEQWILPISKSDIVSLLDISWQSPGLIKGDKIINTLVDLVGDLTIEELPIPYTAVAADVIDEKEIWISSGRLFDAIRASISLPLFFTPVPYEDRYLIDGGVLNPVPIAPTFGDHTDITIAVNLGGPPVFCEPAPAETADDSGDSKFRQKLEAFISDWRKPEKAELGNDWSAYDVANQAFDAMQGAIARQKLAAYPPDVVIEIARNACGTLEFDRGAEMIALGRTKMLDILPA